MSYYINIYIICSNISFIMKMFTFDDKRSNFVHISKAIGEGL